jgi:hypothetical protein
MEWFYFPPPSFETTYGSFPVADTTNLISVPVGLIYGMDNALIIDTTNQTPAFLEYAVMDTNWLENISYDPGTILFAFSPNWASVSQGGTGPGDTAFLIAGGDFSTNSPNGLFEIYIDSAGSNVYIGGFSNGVSVTYASAPISWTSNTFHQLGFEYKSTSNRRSPGTEIYIDSALAATGGAVTIVPTLGADSNGFCTNVFMVGSDGNGLEQARGAFWNMITWSDEYGGWYTNDWSDTSNALVAWQGTLSGGGFGMMKMGLADGQNQDAFFSNNVASLSSWIHYPYTLTDGSFVPFQTLMDTTASNYAVANSNDWQTAALNAALLWAAATGAPATLTNANGNVSYLVNTNEGPLYVVDCNLEAAQTISTTNVWPAGSSGLNLNGTNRTIFMWDEGEPLLTHVELYPRVSLSDSTTTNLADHSTAVASTLVGGGVNVLYGNGTNNLGRAAKGMSFAGNVQAASFLKDIIEMTAEAGTNNMLLSNHSYEHATGWSYSGTSWTWYGYSSISTNADPKFGNYSTYSSNYDELAYNAANYLGVWAAGNDTGNGPPVQPTNHYEYTVGGMYFQTNNSHPLNGDPGGYVTISDDACAKDTLCVGAVYPLTNGYAGTNSVILASFSSCGPTDDGRIKPDVVACGVNVITASSASTNAYEYESGTSFASPSVAGSINLLAQYYAQLHTNAAALLSSTLKALVIATADQCGTNIGPSYKFGWGLMNTAKAASLVANDATNGLKCFIKEVMLSNDTYIQFPIQSSGANPIKVTIAWTDPPGVGNSITNLQNPAIKLVNDLDLRVVSPNGTTNFPYVLNPDLTNRTATARSAPATTGDNIRDNVEQVYIAAPASGTYQVVVTHKGTLQNGAPQWVSIVSTGNTPTSPPPLTINALVQTATNQIAVGWPAVVGERYQVQYVNALSVSSNWRSIGGEVSARLTNVVALLPYTNTVSQSYYRIAQVQ